MISQIQPAAGPGPRCHDAAYGSCSAIIKIPYLSVHLSTEVLFAFRKSAPISTKVQVETEAPTAPQDEAHNPGRCSWTSPPGWKPLTSPVPRCHPRRGCCALFARLSGLGGDNTSVKLPSSLLHPPPSHRWRVTLAQDPQHPSRSLTRSAAPTRGSSADFSIAFLPFPGVFSHGKL